MDVQLPPAVMKNYRHVGDEVVNIASLQWQYVSRTDAKHGAGLFFVPKDDMTRKQWEVAIHIGRKLSLSMRVCSK